MSNAFPPQNYVPAASSVDGIKIYQPAPKEDNQEAIVSFKCPQCGANTAYSVENGGLTCTYCGYYDAPDGEVVGKKAQEFEFKVETLERAAQGWGEERQDISCQNCGARVSVPQGEITVTCPFCGSNKVLQSKSTQTDLRPRFLIPFTIEKAKCQAVAREWLSSSWMTPGELKDRALLRDFNPLFTPYWTFDSRSSADWKAEVGHERTERYYVNGEWKTRTVIDWRWENGHADVDFDDVIVAGTTHLKTSHLDTVSVFDLRQFVAYEPKYLAGIMAKSYDISLEEGWAKGRETMREATRSSCIAQASTSRVRNFSMQMDFSNESWRYVLLPLYVAVYHYLGQPYQILVNGQTGEISGQRPVDWQKVWTLIGLLLAPGFLFGILGLLTLVFGGVGAVFGGIGFFLLVLGVVISLVIYQQAQQMARI